MSSEYHLIAAELGNASLEEAGELRLKVVSPSMAPLFRPGDYVIVCKVPPLAVRRGDVLVIRQGDGFITHRLIMVDQKGWHTKGDRCRLADPPVSAQAIVGLVVGYENEGVRRGLQTRRWAIVNRLLGWLGWHETRCSSPFTAIFFRLLSKVVICGNCSPIPPLSPLP
jgi:signal peptidase I